MDSKYLEIIHSIDKRLAVLEERTEGLPRLKEKVFATASAIAVIISIIVSKLF